jgi:hypothetical protein
LGIYVQQATGEIILLLFIIWYLTTLLENAIRNKPILIKYFSLHLLKMGKVINFY